ncbi:MULTISPECIES: hypothetical protein [Bradyrhizobium]|uniref:hypothetical protein n=1 Tax=Bradyrhizobium TaxID=374 RepID=UPI000941F296|nr:MULTISPECIES: hypothetical protein [Bradyrhizobium]
MAKFREMSPSHERGRRTVEADRGPLSPRAIDAVYAKGRKTIRHDSKEWIGHETQPPQFVEEARHRNYTNDVPLKGERAFLRGGGDSQHIYGSRNQNPDAKHGISGQEAARKRSEAGEKTDGTAKYPHPSGRFTGTGQDCNKSPFSAAHKTYGED